MLTDSLNYVALRDDKVFFVEKIFKYGKKNAEKVVFEADSLGNIYQVRISPREYQHLKSPHNLFWDSRFSVIPDTVNCEIWSFPVDGKKIRKIGDAIVF